ncbi:MAG: hypothetical protein IT580_02695 [Verrucomicrobiales bacterium]|nr:hypothetical protein [Verrucomicrobiales bacterium]
MNPSAIPNPTPLPEAIRIEIVDVGEVVAFATRFFDTAARDPSPTSGIGTAPLTPERARSLAANPHALSSDPALAVAWQGDRCVGFQQVFPGAVQSGAGSGRIFWLCGGFVLPDMRQRGIFAHLVRSLISRRIELVSTSYSPGVEHALRKLGFVEFGPLPFAVTYLRKVHLGHRWGRWIGSHRGDGRAWAARRLQQAAHALDSGPYRVRSIARVTGLDPRSGTSPSAGPTFPRTPEVIDWMLDHPWVRDDAPAVVPAFHFGDRRQRFRYLVNQVVRESGEHAGFFLASHQVDAGGSRWTMLDHQFTDSGALAAALHWQWQVIAELGGVDEVLLPEAAWEMLRASRWFRFLTVRHTRPYLARPLDPQGLLARTLGAARLQFVDCDSAFC